MYIASQILVIMADLLYVVSMFTKNKKWLLFWLIVSDIFFGAHFFFLGAFTGGFMLIADIVFLIIAYILNNYKIAKTYIPSLIFACITITITIFTWNGIISLLPMFGMATYFISMGFNKLYLNKIGGGVRNLCNIVYMILITSYFGAGLEFVLFISSVIGSILSMKNSSKEQHYGNRS